MDDIVIRAERLSKKFARSLKLGMVYGLADIARASLIPHRHRSDGFHARLSDAAHSVGPEPSERDGAEAAGDSRLRPSEFWALRDVSFQLHRGECLGLIGPNGAGKSTLFSILSGIYEPTWGRAEIRGRLQALIALGAGFHPMLSGRENIYVNAAVFGLTTREIDRLVDKIIDFSELGEFIDAPIKTYSSGMLVRLGFSVAAHLDPDILLVDEVLAVGDARFQLKCLDHMRRLRNSGKAQMLVSHYMHNIQGLCDRVIWLDHGRVREMGPADEVTRHYLEHSYGRDLAGGGGASGAGGYPVLIREVAVAGPPYAEGRDTEGTVRVAVRAESRHHIRNARMYMLIRRTSDALPVAAVSMLKDGHALELRPGTNEVAVELLDFPFAAGGYRFYVNFRTEEGTVCLSAGGMSRPFEWRGKSPLCRQGMGPLRPITGIAEGICCLPYRWDIPGGALV